MRQQLRSCTAGIISLFAAMGLTAQTLTTDFVNAGYAITDLGSITDLPTPYGGLTIRPSSPDTLYIGGTANQPGGAVYKVPLVRDAVTQQITGFAGPAVLFAAAANIDGGLSFAPNGTMLYTRYSMNELGQLLPNNTALSIPLTPLGISSSVGSHVLVPAGSPGAGNLIMASYSASVMYKVPFTIGVDGDYQPAAPTASVSVNSLASGPEGIAYVPTGSAGFPNPSMVVSAYSFGKIVVFEVDADGLPVPSTARDMITGLSGAEGALIDPLTGDFLFSTFGGSNRVIRVSGFEAPSALAEIAFAAEPLSVSPNPTEGPLRLTIDAAVTIEAVEVLDMNGRVVVRTGRLADDRLDLSALGSGVYVVRAFTAKGVRLARVMRQ
ncbi:MAG: T9SS type A sorting domain-containing protein [Flavobacteriales bacterium]|nr:T9SS type A sorting domain-containing protein [Flavobacteriales bacterium]